MVLQNNIWSVDNEAKQLYYRSSKAVQYTSEVLILPPECHISSDTYMNALDMRAWKKYTALTQMMFRIKMSGKGKITLIWESTKGLKNEIASFENTQEEKEILEWKHSVPKDIKEGLLYFEADAVGELKIYEAVFETEEVIKQKVQLAIVICTYKRKKELENTITVLKEHIDFTKEDCCLNVSIVDNASELEDSYGKHIYVYHNPNTGGTGGFSRGMQEVVQHLEEFPATHVLLMDDDAKVEFESLVRLRALLSYIRKEYVKEAVAGRMFRLDQPNIQYTALEIWEKGCIRHIGGNVDMEQKSSLFQMNDNTGGRYGGWWFECYPIQFVKENQPIPFFIHCDDVEYGLRHGGTPIILNGIQVWHENFENRQTPHIVYYDVRNSLVVNSLWEKKYVYQRLWRMWARRAVWIITRKKYAEEYMALRGIQDYLKGFVWLIEVDSAENHNKLRNKKNFSCWENFGLCVMVFFNILFKFRKVKETYSNE